MFGCGVIHFVEITQKNQSLIAYHHNYFQQFRYQNLFMLWYLEHLASD